MSWWFNPPPKRYPGGSTGPNRDSTPQDANGNPIVADRTENYFLYDTRGCPGLPYDACGWYNDVIPQFTCPAGTFPGNYYVAPIPSADPPYIGRVTVVTDRKSWRGSTHYQVCARLDASPPVTDPGKSAGKPDTCKGDPCDPFSGNQYEHEADYAAPGAFGLRFERTYNSNVSTSAGSAAMGRHWQHNFQAGISYIQGAISQVATVTRPDGRQIDFTRKNSTEPWLGPADIGDRLTDIAGGGWKLTTSNGAYETYDASGRLTRLDDGAGNYIVLNYVLRPPAFAGATQTAYELDKATDRFGRKISFSYNENRLLSSISLPALSGQTPRTVVFAYKSLGSKGHILETVTHPDASQRVYRYENTAFPTNLTKIVDENGSDFAFIEYDAGGLASRSYHAGTYNGVKNDDIQIVRNSNNSVTITDAVGQIRTYPYDVLLGVPRTKGITEGICSHCGVDSKAVQYDPTNGYRVSATDFKGNIQRYNHDALGRETCRLEGVPGNGATPPALQLTVTNWPAMPVPEPTLVSSYEPSNPAMSPPTSCDGSASPAGWIKRRETEVNYVSGTTRVQARKERSFPTAPELPQRQTNFVYYGEAAGDPSNLVGLLKSVDGPRIGTNVTTYTYAIASDANHTAGDLIGVQQSKASNASISTNMTKHDADGRPISILDGNGTTTTLAYDWRGQPLSRTVDGKQTTYTYWPTGQIKRVTYPASASNPNGNYVRYVYDAAHRLKDVYSGYVQTTDVDVDRIHYELDALGNRISEEYSSNGAIQKSATRAYNVLNQMDAMTSGAQLKTKYTYDLNGNVETVVEPRNPIDNTIYTQHTYDAMNRVVATRDPDNKSTNYVLDVFDNIVSVDDPSAVPPTTYNYNGFGERRSETSPDTGTTYFQHDPAGNRTQAKYQTVAGTDIVVNYKYDGLNRVTRIDYPPNDLTVASANDIVYTYDENASGQNGVGRLTTVTDESGVWTYRYDLQGNVKRVAVNFSKIGGGTFSLDYDYDAANRLQRITYPSDRHVTFIRTGDLITSATTDKGGVPSDLATIVTHAPFGPITSFKYGDAGLTPFTRNLDADYRVSRIKHGTMLDFQYSYLEPVTNRGTENITKIEDLLVGTKTQNFTFDLLNRVMTSSSTAYGTQIFATTSDPYNPVGNRKKTVIAGSTQDYIYEDQKNRLLRVTGGGSTYSYDVAGNATSRGQLKFNYGDGQRLKSVSDYDLPAASDYTYNHNHLGQRVRKKIGAQSLFFMYGLDGELLAEIDGASGTIAKEYAYLEGTPIALFTPDTPLDTDGDGLPNAWETQFGLNLNNAADASGNSDGDKLTALQEYQMGTDPTKGDTDGDGVQDDSDPQPTELNSAWQIPIQRELLH